MRCTQCGTELKVGDRFCEECGAVVSSSPARPAISGAIPVAQGTIPATAPPSGAKMAAARQEDGGGFFSFREMISPALIKILYVLGMMGITAYGAYKALEAWSEMIRSAQSIDGRQVLAVGAGLAVVVLGNLAWRLICEGAILAFSIQEVLVSIERHLKRS